MRYEGFYTKENSHALETRWAGGKVLGQKSTGLLEGAKTCRSIFITV